MRANTTIVDLRNSALIRDQNSEDGSRKSSSDWGGRVHEQDHSGVCQKHVDTRSMPTQFWADEVNTAVYLINRGPSVSLNCGILEEAYTGKEVNVNHLCTFGCISYLYVKLDHISKLDSKCKRRIFIGYGTSECGYRSGEPKNS